MLRDGERLGDYLRRHRVTTLIAVPSLLALLAPAALPDVAAVMAGGEACSAELAAKWRRSGRTRRLLNAYAPTETTIYSTLARCDGPLDQLPGVGQPIPGATVYLLDSRLRPVPLGAAGELFAGGRGLARGYHGRPGLTAERFVPDPFGAAGARLYRTGDLGRWREDGTLELLGRRDEQVKLRGFRVELGEIEAALADHPAVREAAAVVHADEEANGAKAASRLVAYAVLEPAAAVEQNGELDADLRAHLRQRLPEHMLPAAIAVVDALPRLPSGKLDRRSLPAPESLRGAPRVRDHARPRSQTERDVAAVWAEVLKLAPESVGIDDNFFDLGGQSLLAIQVQSRLGERLGRQVPIVALFRHPTIRDLARHLENGDAADETGEAAAVRPEPRARERAAVLHDEQRRRRAGARRNTRTEEPVP